MPLSKPWDQRGIPAAKISFAPSSPLPSAAAALRVRFHAAPKPLATAAEALARSWGGGSPGARRGAAAIGALLGVAVAGAAAAGLAAAVAVAAAVAAVGT